MKAKNRVLPALLLSLFTAAAAPAATAAEFSNVVVFGDSLSDAGTFRPFLRGAGLPASVVAGMGRFTTNPGPVWAELVAQFYGVTPAPSNAGGTIFAQGGARVALTPGVSTPPGMPERSITAQITEYLNANGGQADPNALYAVWGGANDVFFNLGAFQAGAITQAQLQTNVLGAATAEIQQIGRLRAAGARYIAVFTLPDIGTTPAFASSASSGAVTALSAGYNTTLFTGLAAAGIRVIPVDTFALLNELRTNPAAFGFTNVTAPACGPFPPVTTAQTITSLFCNPSNLAAPNAPQTFLFADFVHPTSGAHAILAQFVESLIEGPTQYSLLGEVPLRSRASHIRTLNDGMASHTRMSDGGTFGVFAAGDGASFEVDPGRGTVGLDTSARSVTVGVTMRASDTVSLGLAVGDSRNDGSFGRDAGGFKLDERVISLFGSMRWGGFYGTGVVSLADLRYKDIRRTIRLGPNVRTATASADGSNASAQLTAGYDFAIGRFTVGPMVGLTTQSVDINGFDEAGGGSAGLRMAQQKRKSEVWSVGAKAAVDLGGWTPWVRVTADKERRDEERMVTATPLSLAAIGSSYDLPAYAPDSTFVTTSLGVHGRIGRHVSLGVTYFKVSSREGVKEDGIGGVVSYRF